MRRLAVFGAKGFIGRQLMHYFTQKGFTCDGYDLPECDVTRNEFWHTFDPISYDAILFFVGLTGAERSFEESYRYMSVNEGGLLCLLQRLASFGQAAPKIIFPSSRLVYKGQTEPLTEEAEKQTRTVYAVNKLACEGLLFAYFKRFGLPYVVLRICVPYGSLVTCDYSYGTIGFFLRQIAERQVISLFGGGIGRRTFTHVADICQTVAFVVENPVTGVYNIGGDDYSLAEAAALVVSQKGGSVRSVPWPSDALAIESGSTVFDSTKLDALMKPVYRHLADCTL